MSPTRRHVIQGLAAAAGLAAARSVAAAPGRAGARVGGGASRSLVVRARRDGVIDGPGGAPHDAKLTPMLDAAVARAVGTHSATDAFRRLFKPSDVVGIKVGTLAGRGLSPNPELVLRLVGWLERAGVPAHQIVIWDRTDRELAQAGFTLNRDGAGVRCFGTNDDYDWTPREWGAGGSCFARLLVRELTALINVGVLKDHDLAGISAGLKNWYGAIHNPNKHHGNGCDPYIAHLAAYPLIRRKLRLTVVDGLTAQCQGGPARSPRWAWAWGGVLVSTDPVALDAVAWQVIEMRRKTLGLGSLQSEQREPKWIATAAKLGLGHNRLEEIDVVSV
jgi:hypothetical protein